MVVGEVRQVMRGVRDLFERRECISKLLGNLSGSLKLLGSQMRARIGPMQLFWIERRECMDEAVGAGAGARAAQHCALQRGNCPVAVGSAEAAQRMLQQSEQRLWR